MLRKIPILGPVFCFSLSTHKQSILKFLFLWIASTLPIIITALLSRPSADNQSNFFTLLYNLLFSTDQFVYTAAFLPPAIYIIIDRYVESRHNENPLRVTLRRLFPGYLLIFFAAVITIFFTVISYAAQRTNEPHFMNTYLYHFSTNLSPWLYFFSAYCLYLSILDGNIKEPEFVDENRKNEQDITSALSNRLKKRGQ